MTEAQVRAMMTTGRLPQRLLLSGGDGLTLALELAAGLQDVPPQAIERNLDTLILRDQGKSLKIDHSDAAVRDGQGEYESVRGVMRWCHQSRGDSPWRIVIIEHIERATREAPHALLKLLEEPPAGVRFILTTANHHQLLDTILSRVQVIVLPTLDFTVAPDSSARALLGEASLVGQFRQIEALHKAAKKSEDGRGLVRTYARELVELCRTPSQRQWLDLALDTYQRLERNANMRATLERFVLKRAQKQS